ncbi:MAG TPA: pitrilysin family protein, partial [Gammaproteobacteria bacterium]|nr:pitrilysin family protein [Gammaproteobacteria bacterium]
MYTDMGSGALRFGVSLLLAWLLPLAAAQAMPAIQHWVTEKGARVYFVPAPELPMVDVNITFAAGSARDDGHPGLASLTSTLLDKGAAGLSADEIAVRVESLGARLGSDSARDMALLSLRSLSDSSHLQPALDIMRDVAGAPDFNPADFARERERMLVALRHSEQSPSTVAEYTFYKSVYGDHPYGSRPEGTVASLKDLTVDQVRAFYRRYYVVANAVIGIVGDIDRAGAEALAERVTAKLQTGKRADPVPPVEPLTDSVKQRIFHPSTQTHVRMGAPGLHRGDPDYFPLYVGNHVLGGGGLVSRLNEAVREQRGLSYSVNSYFSPMEQDGPYLFSLQTRNDQADVALTVMRETLETYLEDGPTQAELTASVNNITGGFPLLIENNAKILGYIVMIGFYGLPLDYLETFNDRVSAVTREQIMDAYRR